MHVFRRLIECLTLPQRYFLPTLHLHHHAPFQHIDKHMSIVPVLSARPARRVFHHHHRALFVVYTRQFPRHERGHLGLLSRGGSHHEAQCDQHLGHCLPPCTFVPSRWLIFATHSRNVEATSVPIGAVLCLNHEANVGAVRWVGEDRRAADDARVRRVAHHPTPP